MKIFKEVNFFISNYTFLTLYDVPQMFNWIEIQTLGRLSHDFNVFLFKPSPRS